MSWISLFSHAANNIFLNHINVSVQCPFLLQFVHVSLKVSQTTQNYFQDCNFHDIKSLRKSCHWYFLCRPTMLNFHFYTFFILHKEQIENV